MMRTETRFDPKRKRVDHKKTQFANAQYQEHDYPNRLSFYDVPPTQEISLEEFETWAIDRLRILAEIEACSFRNKSPAETAAHLDPLLLKYLPLSANSAAAGGIVDQKLRAQRRKDHYSHYILRLAFSRTEDLRRRFARVETMLFRLRFEQDNARERQAFIEGLNLNWEIVQEEEKRELAEALLASTPKLQRIDLENWFKVDWTRVPELVEHRTVLVRKGKAYVPMREQASMVLTEFTTQLDKGLELTSRALPRLDEDDRLSPILDHLSKNFATPDAGYSDSSVPGAPISAANIDNLSQHFPLCMKHLHSTLRKNNHLKHFGRLQYTLFLKGIGLTLEDCLVFWRQAFKTKSDDEFNKEYRYNVRHTYGDVGGDANRRGRGYTPYSCQKILTEHAPGTGEAHGCPYRTFEKNIDNLTSMLQATGVHDREVLRGVKEDVDKKRFHMACNRVFDWAHKQEIRKVKDEGTWGPAELDTIVHPNTYFKRSYLLKNLGNVAKQDVRMED